MTNNGPCPYVCGNKSAFGYCLTTVCVNPLFKRKYEETQRFLGEYVKIVRCKDCKWWTKQEASLQGRCDAYGMYPTGEWYCAMGERR